MWQRHRSLILAAVGVAAVALLVVSYVVRHNDDSSSKKSAADWANGVCTALSTWQSDLKSSVDSVKSSPSQSSIEQAVDDTKSSTNTLVSTLKDLGTPSTESGDKAKSTVDDLSSQLQTGVSSIQTTVENVSGVSGSLDAVSKVSSTLAAMRDDVKAAYQTISSLPTGELEQAFKDSSSCQSLKESVS
jgi:copper chaperone CopZ